MINVKLKWIRISRTNRKTAFRVRINNIGLNELRKMIIVFVALYETPLVL